MMARGLRHGPVLLGLRGGHRHRDGPGDRQAGGKRCASRSAGAGKVVDIDFAVRCVPVDMAGQRFLLLFLRDVSDDRRRGALERTFFHDVANLLTSLCVAGDLLASLHQDDALIEGLQQGLDLLAKEVEIQRALSQAGVDLQPAPKEATSTRLLLRKVRTIFATHPAAAGKRLAIGRGGLPLVTNPGLLVRVLLGLVTNALEGTPPGGRVRVWAGKEPGGVVDPCLEPAGHAGGHGPAGVPAVLHDQAGAGSRPGHVHRQVADGGVPGGPGRFHVNRGGRDDVPGAPAGVGVGQSCKSGATAGLVRACPIILHF